MTDHPQPTEAELSELKRRLTAASKGEWKNCTLETGDCENPFCTGIYIDGVGVLSPTLKSEQEARANAELAVAAVNALPGLISELEAARVDAKKWKVEATTAWQGQEAGSEWNWELKAENERLEAALEWYAEKARDCRKIGAEGDEARHALDRDGGERAREVLELEAAAGKGEK